MAQVIKQAGLMFTAWFSSCLSCLWSPEDYENEGHQQATYNRGVEREMQISHSQPHLVPPMKLVFYDKLPSPGSATRSSFLPPSRVEDRNLASKASYRASLLVRRKAPKRPTISAPSDFRRVDPPSSRQRSFRPLELSIYMPGNRLSDLPEFDSFQDIEELAKPSPPPKALASPFDMRARRCQSTPFHLARKPVGSGSRRSSMATLMTLDQVPECGNAVTNPLVPHFSTFIPSDGSTRLIRPRSAPLDGATTPAFGKPLPFTPEQKATSFQTVTYSPTPSTKQSFDHWRSTSKRNPASTSSLKGQYSPQTPTTILQHSRSRKMSDSSVSSIMTSITGRPGTAPSLSSAVTAATTMQYSMSEAQAYKEIESPIAIPLSAKYMDAYPRVYEEEEDEEQRQQQRLHGYGYQSGYECDRRFPESVVGLAF